MNTSTIMDLVRQDPKIPDDIPGFLKRVNDQSIRVVDKVTTVTEDVVRMVSYAEQHGGPATEDDVNYALKLLAQEPLVAEAKERLADALAAVSAGEVTDSASLAAKLGEAKAADPNPVADVVK